MSPVLKNEESSIQNRRRLCTTSLSDICRISLRILQPYVSLMIYQLVSPQCYTDIEKDFRIATYTEN